MKGKKLIKYIGGSGLLGVFILGAMLPVSNMETAEAASLSSVVFEDKFSENVLSNHWLKNDFVIDEQSYYSMRLNNQTDYGSAMLYSAYEIHDDCVISFDFYQSEVVTEKKKDNWFGILLGYNGNSAHFTNGNAAILSYGRGQTQMMDDGDGASETLVATSYDDHAKYADSFMAVENIQYTVELVISYTGQRYSDGENLYQVDGYYYEKSGKRSSVPKFTYKGIAADGYFGFSAMSSSVMDVSNLQIFEGNERVAYENFQDENGDGEKLVPTTENSDWKGVNCSELKLYNYFNGRMDTHAKADGLLLSNYDLTLDSLNKKEFSVSFETEIVDLPENGIFGLALGLSVNAETASEGAFVGLMGMADDKFSFVYMLNGDIISQTSAISKRLYDKDVISFIGYYDGRLEVKLAGYTASFEKVAKAGYMAVATLGEPCTAYFDNFTIERAEYINFDAPNHAIDFTGVKETPDGDFVYVERYVDERLWFLGSGVAFPKRFREGANYIQVTDANERTFFGAKQTYSEFICRFSITVTQNRADSNGASIGLSFGKSNRNDSVKDSQSVMFNMTDSGMVLQGYHCALVGADSKGIVKQYETYPTLDFWSSENWETSPATYRVMVIARGGCAYVYYANEENLSDMSVCRAVVTDVETSGYVTVSALGGATFRLNDFAVTNISLNNKMETASIGASTLDEEYINVDFTTEELYTASGETMMLGKGISLGYNSLVKVNAQFTDFLAYVDVNSVAGNGILLKVGEESIRLNSDGTVYSGLAQVGGSGNFDFNSLKNGGVIMVEVVGAKLSIGVVEAGQSADLLENSVAIFDMSSRVAPINISVATVEDTVLSLESIRLYTLQPTIKIEADNWELADTEVPDKNTMPGEEMSGKWFGCSGIASFSSMLPMMGISLLVLRKKERVDHE